MANNGIQLNSVSVEHNEGGIVTLNIEVSASSVQEARARVIKEFSKRIRVPGFRPGAVPAGIVRRNVGDEAIAQEISDQIIPAAYQAAIEQENITPLEQGQVDSLTFDAFSNDGPLSFVARVIVRPEVTLGDTSALSTTKKDVNITDEDVDNALEQMRQEAAYLKNAAERPVQDGDVLFAEVQVFVDGAPRSEEPANLRGFQVGQSGFVPNIDDQFIGMNLDETKRFSTTYPEDFPDQELANKEAEFEVKVTAIKERVVPEITDEFAQIRRAQNVDDLKAQLKNYLALTGEREARREVRENLLEQIAETSSVEVPVALVDARLQERLQGIQQELEQNGATIEAYLNAINSTQEQLENDLREELSKELKNELVLDEIARQQNFPVSQDEVINHFQIMAQVSETPIEELVKNVPYQNVVTSIKQRKAIDFLVENAKVTDESGNEVSFDTPAMQDEAEEAIEEAIEAELLEDELDEIESLTPEADENAKATDAGTQSGA